MKEVSRSSRENQENMDKNVTKSKNTEKPIPMDDEYVRTKRPPRTPPVMTNEQVSWFSTT